MLISTSLRLAAFGSVVLLAALRIQAENWPCWRGPRLDGSSVESQIPLHWSSESNLAWKTALPGTGHASPVVWQDRIFTVSAVPETGQRLLLCLERHTGKILWTTTVLEAPLEHKHALNSYASSTPATDGQLVFTAFLDRDQMYVAAHDFVGKKRWEARPGVFTSMHGFCSSPILYRDKVILNGDHDGNSYLVALSRSDGHILWKTPRQHHTRSYCAPLIQAIAGRQQLILSGDKCVASYDPDSGEQRWVIDGPTEQFVASPVYNRACGLVFIIGGFPEHHVLAIDPSGEGNVTQSHIVWRTTQGAAYVPSPIVFGNWFLTISDSGVAHCFEAASGKILWKQSLGQQHASLVSAAGLILFLNDNGVMNLIRPGPTFDRVAQNPIGEHCFASPAISEGHIFLRGADHLFCIGAVR